MDVKIGSAPDSWGVWFPSDDKQIPWQRCLDEIAEAGYEWTELGPYGYLPTDRATLQSELSKRGLRASGTFAMGHLEDEAAWPGLEKQVLGAGESLAYLGAEYLILIDDTYTNLWTGEATAPGRLDDEAWKRLVDRVHYVVDLVRDRFGLQVVFHPHAETHVEYEDQIERLLSQTDPERVVLCLDTGHHAPGTNIEFIVSQLLRLGRLGAFDFNSRFYADDDLMVGAADPFQLFRIMYEVVRGGGLDVGSEICFMLDQCHNIEEKIPAQIRSVLNVQEMTARALLVDRNALIAAEQAGDVLGANAVLMDAFYTDVRSELAEWRSSRGLPSDPEVAYRCSGYGERIVTKRVGGTQAGWGA